MPPRCWCTFLVRSQPLKSQPLKSQPPQIPALRTRASVQKGGIQRQSLVTAPAYRGYSSTGRVLIALKIHDAA